MEETNIEQTFVNKEEIIQEENVSNKETAMNEPGSTLGEYKETVEVQQSIISGPSMIPQNASEAPTGSLAGQKTIGDTSSKQEIPVTPKPTEATGDSLAGQNPTTDTFPGNTCIKQEIPITPNTSEANGDPLAGQKTAMDTSSKQGISKIADSWAGQKTAVPMDTFIKQEISISSNTIEATEDSLAEQKTDMDTSSKQGIPIIGDSLAGQKTTLPVDTLIKQEIPITPNTSEANEDSLKAISDEVINKGSSDIPISAKVKEATCHRDPLTEDKITVDKHIQEGSQKPLSSNAATGESLLMGQTITMNIPSKLENPDFDTESTNKETQNKEDFKVDLSVSPAKNIEEKEKFLGRPLTGGEKYDIRKACHEGTKVQIPKENSDIPNLMEIKIVKPVKSPLLMTPSEQELPAKPVQKQPIPQEGVVKNTPKNQVKEEDEAKKKERAKLDAEKITQLVQSKEEELKRKLTQDERLELKVSYYSQKLEASKAQQNTVKVNQPKVKLNTPKIKPDIEVHTSRVSQDIVKVDCQEKNKEDPETIPIAEQKPTIEMEKTVTSVPGLMDLTVIPKNLPKRMQPKGKMKKQKPNFPMPEFMGERPPDYPWDPFPEEGPPHGYKITGSKGKRSRKRSFMPRGPQEPPFGPGPRGPGPRGPGPRGPGPNEPPYWHRQNGPRGAGPNEPPFRPRGPECLPMGPRGPPGAMGADGPPMGIRPDQPWPMGPRDPNNFRPGDGPDNFGPFDMPPPGPQGPPPNWGGPGGPTDGGPPTWQGPGGPQTTWPDGPSSWSGPGGPLHSGQGSNSSWGDSSGPPPQMVGTEWMGHQGPPPQGTPMGGPPPMSGPPPPMGGPPPPMGGPPPPMGGPPPMSGPPPIGGPSPMGAPPPQGGPVSWGSSDNPSFSQGWPGSGNGNQQSGQTSGVMSSNTGFYGPSQGWTGGQQSFEDWQNQMSAAMGMNMPYQQNSNTTAPDKQSEEWYASMKQWYDYAQWMQTMWSQWYSAYSGSSDTQATNMTMSTANSMVATTETTDSGKAHEGVKQETPNTMISAPATLKKESHEKSLEMLKANTKGGSLASAMETVQLKIAQMRKEKEKKLEVKNKSFVPPLPEIPPDVPPPPPEEIPMPLDLPPIEFKIASRPGVAKLKLMSKRTDEAEKMNIPDNIGDSGVLSSEEEEELPKKMKPADGEPLAKKLRTDSPSTERETKLWIGNLPAGIKASDVKELVGQHGKVAGCKVGVNKRDGSTFALVMMPLASDATHAAETLHYKIFKGTTLFCRKLEGSDTPKGSSTKASSSSEAQPASSSSASHSPSVGPTSVSSPSVPASPKDSGSSGKSPSTKNKQLTFWVGNLAANTKAKDMKMFMGQFGKVVSCKIGTHKQDGLFALVTMENSDFGPPVATLQQQLHGTMLQGLRLIVRRVKK